MLGPHLLKPAAKRWHFMRKHSSQFSAPTWVFGGCIHSSSTLGGVLRVGGTTPPMYWCRRLRCAGSQSMASLHFVALGAKVFVSRQWPNCMDPHFLLLVQRSSPPLARRTETQVPKRFRI